MSFEEVLMVLGVLFILYIVAAIWKRWGIQLVGCLIIILFVVVVVGTFLVHLLGF